MSIYIEKANIFYLAVPKCACTSLKRFVHEVQTGEEYANAKNDGKPVHQAYPTRPFGAVRKQIRQQGLKSAEKMAVIRHPVDRIVSCYENKIKSGLLIGKGDDAVMTELGLERAPSLETFVERLEDYHKVHRQIFLHSAPLRFHLGAKPKNLARIFDLSEVGEFVDLVNSRAGTSVALPHGNKTAASEKVAPSEVTDRVKEIILEKFKDDMTLFGSYLKGSKFDRA